MSEHLYIVSYDISDAKRWRRVFRTMKGYGEWLQLSVFQCRLNATRHAELIALLDTIIHHAEDHILCIDVGKVENVTPRISSLGKESYHPVERRAIIV